MLEKMYDLFGWPFYQRHAFDNMLIAIKNFFADGLAPKRLIASFMAIIELFCAAVFKTPQPAMGAEIDLSKYERVLFDDFDGDSLNEDIWQCRGTYRDRAAFMAPSQIKVENGNLVITAEYRNEGVFGEGWYSAEVALKEWQTYGGYFEIKCRCSKGTGFWSAFWMQSNNSYDHEGSAGGIGGAEIDIFESMGADALLKKNKSCVTQTVWYNGGDDNPDEIDKVGLGTYYADDIYDTYNTYGVLWTKDEYVFYVNGKETARTSTAVSNAEEVLLISLCPPAEINFSHDYKTEFIIDSVSIYR